MRFLGFVLLVSSIASAQTDLHITGPQAGFPVAVPQLCDAGGALQFNKQIPEVISKNLELSGLFRVIQQNSYVETPGKCLKPEEVAYSDWSVIGAEGLVRGEIMAIDGGKTLDVSLYLLDIQQKRPVIGKKYRADISDFRRIADRFSNEIIGFFTGEKGVFGSKVAYVSRIGRFKELFVMNLDGSDIKQLTRERGLAITPAWSPAGTEVIYTSYKTKKPDLYAISSEGGNSRRITKRPGLELGAEYTPDGTQIVSSASVNGISNIVLFDLKGRLKDVVTRSNAIDISPSFSPDGTRLAFCSNRGGGPQIYVKTMGDGQVQRISFTGSNYCTSPTWSPKGDKIAFVCRSKGNQLFVSSPDGRQVMQVTFRGNNEDPHWSPDGRYLVFSSDFGKGGPRNIALLPLLTARVKQISFAKSEDSQPAWSPRME